MSDEEDDIVLSELSDEPRPADARRPVRRSDGRNRGRHPDPAGPGLRNVLGKALVDGMTIVGIDFRDGILFVPEVLLAANAMKGGMAILRPLLAETGQADRHGHRHRGDIHDIGKNLRDDARGRGLWSTTINNGRGFWPRWHKPDILGMSALLTTTMPYMKVVIDTLVEKGLRDDYIVLVGGAPLNEEFGQAVGADAYCRDAAEAATTAVRMVQDWRRAPDLHGDARLHSGHRLRSPRAGSRRAEKG